MQDSLAPITEKEIEWAATVGSECGCTGRCQIPPHFTCSTKPREEEIVDILLLARNAQSYAASGYSNLWTMMRWSDDVRASGMALARAWCAANGVRLTTFVFQDWTKAGRGLEAVGILTEDGYRRDGKDLVGRTLDVDGRRYRCAGLHCYALATPTIRAGELFSLLVEPRT